MIAGWPVLFQDQFSTTTGAYSYNTGDTYNLFGGTTLNQSNHGVYVFHSGLVQERNANSTSGGGAASNQNEYFTAFANTVSAETTNSLPDDIDITSRAYRTDLWYDNDNGYLPVNHEDFLVLAQYVRPTMRFTPYASYEISHSSDVPGVFQIFRAGLQGPIDDQIYMDANAGYAIDNTGRDSAIWNLYLRHDAGPYTTEELEIAQDLSDFRDQIITTEYYRLWQKLGPTVNGILFADNTYYDELSNNGTGSRTQQDVGLCLSCALGPFTDLSASAIYSHQDFNAGFNTDTFTGRVTLSRTISDKLYFTGDYEYLKFDSSQASRSYYENIVTLSLVKYFH
jgi:hypothetical protein